MSSLVEFKKCELEPNILCDMGYSCLNCVKQENIWAETWINGIEEAEAEIETDRIETVPITVELEARRRN